MQSQRGNFLLQALLALGAIFAFVPFLARQMESQSTDTRMYAATHQVDVAQTAARIFIRENANNLPFETTIVSGNDFADLLEPYGLPLGFVPKTALGQNMALVIRKTPVAVSAYLELTGGDLTGVERAELARRIGFYAAPTDNGVNVGIELQEIYSDVVRRNETDLDNGGFLTDLNMGGNTLNNVGNMFANNGEFATGQFTTISITGIESGKKERSNIDVLKSAKAVFQSQVGEAALSLTRGTLYTNTASTRTLSMYGDTGHLTTTDASVYDLSMTAGRTSFTGPADWNIRGSVVSDYISFSTERLDISSYLMTTRGQDVYIDEETLDYATRSGIDVDILRTANVTMRDQTSAGLNSGLGGSVVLDIRPGGTSLLPDVLVDGIDNDAFAIIADPASDDDKTVSCKDIISAYDGAYNKQSLSQYLICQYVYWQRLEKRIDIKQCLMAGGSDCF